MNERMRTHASGTMDQQPLKRDHAQLNKPSRQKAKKQRSSKMSAKKASMGTFQPLRHRSGTMRDRLHNYTKRTLGAGGSMNEAVSSFIFDQSIRV